MGNSGIVYRPGIVIGASELYVIGNINVPFIYFSVQFLVLLFGCVITGVYVYTILRTACVHSMECPVSCMCSATHTHTHTHIVPCLHTYIHT